MGHSKYVGMKHTWEKIYIYETHITDEICGTHEIRNVGIKWQR